MAQPKPDGVQAETATECEGHRRVGVIEGAWWICGFAEKPDGLDQFFVGVRHGWMGLSVPVAVLDHHRVPACDLDVLGLWDAQNRAQASVPEDGLRHGIGITGLQFPGPQCRSLIAELFSVGVDDGADDCPTLGLPIILGHHRAVLGQPAFTGLTDLLGGLSAKRHHGLPVDVVIRLVFLLQELVTGCHGLGVPIGGCEGGECPGQGGWFRCVAGHRAPPWSSSRLRALACSSLCVRRSAATRYEPRRGELLNLLGGVNP